jgi:hypothetical protein
VRGAGARSGRASGVLAGLCSAAWASGFGRGCRRLGGRLRRGARPAGGGFCDSWCYAVKSKEKEERWDPRAEKKGTIPWRRLGAGEKGRRDREMVSAMLLHTQGDGRALVRTGGVARGHAPAAATFVHASRNESRGEKMEEDARLT